MKIKYILPFLILICTGIFAEKYTLYFTDIRYSTSKRNFYFMRWDMISARQANSRKRFVQGYFNGKYIIKAEKYLRGIKQEEMNFDKNAACRVIVKYKRSRILYKLFYNSGGFIPYKGGKFNLVKKITYKYGRPKTLTLYNGRGRKIAVRRLR